MATTGVAIGGVAQTGTAAAADANDQHYCYEDNRCNPKFEPGTPVEVDGPSNDSIAGTWETCCKLESCSAWKFWSPFHQTCTDQCDEAGYRQDGEQGTVRGTCEYSGSVLVEWDDGQETHIAEFTLSER